MHGKSNMETYITMCKIDSQQELLYGSGNSSKGYQPRGVEAVGGRREVQEEGDIYIPMADSC